MFEDYLPDSYNAHDDAVNKYNAWMRSKEGVSASPEVRRQVRKKFFSAAFKKAPGGSKAIMDPKDRVNRFLQTDRAQKFRDLARSYKYQAQANGEKLNYRALYNKVIADNADLRDLSIREKTELFNRYIMPEYDPYSNHSIDNLEYDNVMMNKDKSLAHKMAYSAGLTLTNNVIAPAAKGVTSVVTGIPYLAGMALDGTGRLVGLDKDNWIRSAGRAVKTPQEWMDKKIDTWLPTRHSQTVVGTGLSGAENLERVNQAISLASSMSGLSAGAGALNAAGKAAGLASKAAPASQSSSFGNAFIQNPKTAATDLAKHVKAHPYSSVLQTGFGGLMLYPVVAPPDPWSDPGSRMTPEELAMPAIRLDEKTGKYILDESTDLPYVVQGEDGNADAYYLRPANPAAHFGAYTKPDVAEARARGFNIVSAMVDQNKAGYEINPVSDPAPANTTNPDNPPPAGSDDSAGADGKPKVSWWDSIDESQLWKAGAAVGLGALGLPIKGWAGYLATGALAGLGYAYGDKIPEWWDKFMNAVNTK